MKNLIHVIYINSLKNFINIHQGDKYNQLGEFHQVDEFHKGDEFHHCEDLD